MKRMLAVLGVLALLATLFALASAPVSSAGEDNCPKSTEVTDTTRPDCKPDFRKCKEALDIDKETLKLLSEVKGWDWETCCIDWDAEGVPAWAEQYRCDPAPCQAELGTEILEYLEATYGDLFNTDVCCIEVDELANIPADDLKYRCEVPEPTPTEVPTEEPTEGPTEEPTPEPTQPPVIVLPPQTVTTTIVRAPAFTG